MPHKGLPIRGVTLECGLTSQCRLLPNHIHALVARVVVILVLVQLTCGCEDCTGHRKAERVSSLGGYRVPLAIGANGHRPFDANRSLPCSALTPAQRPRQRRGGRRRQPSRLLGRSSRGGALAAPRLQHPAHKGQRCNVCLEGREGRGESEGRRNCGRGAVLLRCTPSALPDGAQSALTQLDSSTGQSAVRTWPSTQAWCRQQWSRPTQADPHCCTGSHACTMQQRACSGPAASACHSSAQRAEEAAARLHRILLTFRRSPCCPPASASGLPPAAARA